MISIIVGVDDDVNDDVDEKNNKLQDGNNRQGQTMVDDNGGKRKDEIKGKDKMFSTLNCDYSFVINFSLCL